MHNSEALPQNIAVKVSYRAWLIWGLAAAYFFCDYFARVSIGVMVNDLVGEFQLSSLALGSLSAFFYYPYVFMQIPVGVLVDRYGVRTLLISMCLLTGISCSVFGAASTLWMAQVGRFLLGFGAAFAFVSALKLASEWFPSNKLGFLAGLTQALGMLGAAVGEYPVAISVGVVGWRYTMHGMAIIFVILCLLIALFVFDRESNEEAHPKDVKVSKHMLQNLMIVLRNPQSWINALYAGFLFAPTGAFAEFWGPTYLIHVQGMSHDMAAVAISMIFIGWGVGGPLMGFVSDRILKRKPVMLLSAITGLIFMTTVLYIPGLSAPIVLILLFLFGVSNNGVAIAYAVASEINPRRISGASMAFANMMSVIVGTILLPLIGFIIDLQHGQIIVNGQANFDPAAFQCAMLTLPVALVISIALMFFLRETYCLPLEKRK